MTNARFGDVPCPAAQEVRSRSLADSPTLDIKLVGDFLYVTAEGNGGASGQLLRIAK